MSVATTCSFVAVACATQPEKPKEPVTATSPEPSENERPAESPRDPGPTPPAEHREHEAPPTEADAASGGDESSGAGDATAEATPPPEPPAPSPIDRVDEICAALCDRTQASCSERAAQFCRASCRDYASAAALCPVEVESALTCQSNAEDFVLCSNIADERCAPAFRRLKRCRSGEIAPLNPDETDGDSDEPDPGWKRVELTDLGVAHPLPDDGETQEVASGYRVQRNDSTWAVEPFDGLPGKVTASRLLRVATTYVGNACQPKLRLHGRYETGEVGHVRFTTVCDDGTHWEGMLHFWAGNWVAAWVKSPSAEGLPPERELEHFLFGFEQP